MGGLASSSDFGFNPARPRQIQHKPLYGKKSLSDNARIKPVVPRRLAAFVGRFHIDTDSDDLTDYLRDAGVTDPMCTKLKAKNGR
jgi:hypothetical protein